MLNHKLDLATARGGLGTNGLNTDDLDDDEDYNEEESDELMGNRFSGLPIRTTDDSRYQSVLCMYIIIIIFHSI
jgi:hypothetical protein